MTCSLTNKVKKSTILRFRMEYRLNRYIKVQDGLQVEEIYEGSGWTTGLIDILRFRIDYRFKRYIKVQDGLQVE